MTTNDRLGMNRPILRRDFLNGAAVTGLGLAARLPGAAGAPQDRPGYDPPGLTGLRGSHPGSFEVAHSLRDGTFWTNAPPPQPGEDSYDLVIVGGGISGLSAAHFYREANPGARILILDNHDDVGGHAKRNEFHLGGRLELINGGTLEIDSPRPYSKVADGLLRTLGIAPVQLEAACARPDFYSGMGLDRAAFFNRETFGSDHLTLVGKRPWADALAGAPLSPAARLDVARVYEASTDYMAGLSSAEKKDRLSRISYRDYLLHVVHADPGVLPYFQALSHDEWGVGIDAVSALDMWGFGEAPGFQGLQLAPGSAPRMGYTAAGYADGGSYSFHFPDGNASIVRLLVRKLLPAALPGSSVADAVTSRLDYAQMDRADAATRIRLSSIVVGVRNIGAPASSTGVEIAYSRFGKLVRVRGKACVLACYNMMIPYLCPELPQAQKDALHYLVKIPLVYTTVALTNWRAFQKLGAARIYAPGCYHSTVWLNPAVDIGGYASPTSPDQPMLIRMTRVPCHPGLDERSQHRLGHADILATSFETFERNIRDQLARMLGPAGFDPARDITAITVNRWPHGYAYEYNPLFDPVWAPGQAPNEIGRARFGRIVIANSDAAAAAYTDAAIDQAHRAAGELG